MDQEQTTATNQAAVLKELSDIKASLAVNTNETQNIKSSIIEIKSDIKEIKTDFVNRREFNEAMKAIREELPLATIKDHENRMRRLEWWGAIAVGFLYAIQAYFQFIKK